MGYRFFCSILRLSQCRLLIDCCRCSCRPSWIEFMLWVSEMSLPFLLLPVCARMEFSKHVSEKKQQKMCSYVIQWRYTIMSVLVSLKSTWNLVLVLIPVPTGSVFSVPCIAMKTFVKSKWNDFLYSSVSRSQSQSRLFIFKPFKSRQFFFFYSQVFFINLYFEMVYL